MEFVYRCAEADETFVPRKGLQPFVKPGPVNSAPTTKGYFWVKIWSDFYCQRHSFTGFVAEPNWYIIAYDPTSKWGDSIDFLGSDAGGRMNEIYLWGPEIHEPPA